MDDVRDVLFACYRAIEDAIRMIPVQLRTDTPKGRRE